MAAGWRYETGVAVRALITVGPYVAVRRWFPAYEPAALAALLCTMQMQVERLTDRVRR